MKSLKQYSIPHTGLKLEKHHFEYDVNDTFFDEFEYSLAKKGTLKVKLVLDKQETILILSFQIDGFVYLNCDRCLSEYPQKISTSDRLIAKFSEDTDIEDATEEVIVLTKNDTEVNVAPFIYEMITLAIPYINLCDAPGNDAVCDEEMIAKLKELSVEKDDNNEKEEDKADPRWEALKKIKNN